MSSLRGPGPEQEQREALLRSILIVDPDPVVRGLLTRVVKIRFSDSVRVRCLDSLVEIQAHLGAADVLISELLFDSMTPSKALDQLSAFRGDTQLVLFSTDSACLAKGKEQLGDNGVYCVSKHSPASQLVDVLDQIVYKKLSFMNYQ